MSARMKRTKAQRDVDRELISDLVLHQSMFQADIARRLNERKDIKYKLSQQMISFDLRQIQKKWIRETMKVLDAYKAEQLKKIDQIESELWSAWYRSCSVRSRQRVEKSTLGGGKVRLKKVTTTYKPVGNPRFLKRIQRCIEMRCRILGLFASLDATKNASHKVTQTDAKRDYVTPTIREVIVRNPDAVNNVKRKVADVEKDKSEDDGGTKTSA